MRNEREIAEDQAMRFLSQRTSGPWTDSDTAALESWLGRSSANQAAYFRLHAAWQEAGRLSALGKFTPTRRPFWAGLRMKPWAFAAIVLLAVGSGLVYFRDALFRTHSFSTVIGGLQTIPTADGSKITLNTDSQVRIVINAVERSIELTHGEAFFEVAHDATRPFVVRAGAKQIVAVGTQFSVRRDGDSIRVAVTEGTVRVEAIGTTRIGGRMKEAVLLSAGAVAQSQSGAVKVQKRSVAEVEQRLTWRTGMLTFRETRLADAIAEINRYNTRQIVIEDPRIANLQVGGVFRATNVDPFIHLLQERFDVQVENAGNHLVLAGK